MKKKTNNLYTSASEKFTQTGARRLYNKTESEQDYTASRRRRSTQIIASNKKKSNFKRNSRAFKNRADSRINLSTNTTSKRSAVDNKLKNRKNSSKNKNTATFYTARQIATKNLLIDSQNCSKCKSSNDCGTNCCDSKYNIRRLENVVFFFCLSFAVLATLFVQDHNYLDTLKEKAMQFISTVDNINENSKVQSVDKVDSLITNTTTNKSVTGEQVTESKSEKLQNQEVLSPTNQQAILPQGTELEMMQCISFLQPITIIVENKTEDCDDKPDNIYITICEPNCEKQLDTYAGIDVTVDVENLYLVEGDLNIYGCGGGGGFTGDNLQNNSGGLGKPIYTSPINWGVPPLRQTQYGGSFSLSSSGSSTTYNNYPCYTLHPPSPGSLATIFVFSTLHNFLRLRFV